MSELVALVALCTLQEVKDYSDTKRAGADEVIKDLINVVSADCAAYCRRAFLKKTHTDEKYTSDGSNILFLRDYPLVSVSSITPYEGAAALTVNGTDFDWDAESGEVRLRNGRTFMRSSQSSINNVKVTYEAGYDGVANLPWDLRFSIIQGVAHKLNEFDKKGYSVTRQDKGDAGSADYIETAYPEHVTTIWKRHKRKVYA